jgi:hypothetical protein
VTGQRRPGSQKLPFGWYRKTDSEPKFLDKSQGNGFQARFAVNRAPSS